MNDKDNFEKDTNASDSTTSTNYFNSTNWNMNDWNKEPEKDEPEFITHGKASKYDWKDIYDEEFRVYVFPCGCKVVIEHPLKLNVSESGGHRIFDSNGISHYIPSGWVHLFWQSEPGHPHFRF